MIRYFSISFFLLYGLFSSSQELAISDTIFLDKNWTETKDRREAVYYRGAWFNEEDSTWLVHDFYLETHTIQMIGLYKDKVQNMNQIGEFRYFYKNGKLRALYHFTNGIIDGKTQLYYENGNIEAIRSYQSGQLKDTIFTFYENGNPREIKYVNPDFNEDNLAEAEKQFVLVSYFGNDGTQQVKEGTGTKTEYYPSGVKRQTIEYENGFPNGDWTQYTVKRKIISKMNFKNGKFISGMMYPKRKKDVFASLYREPRFPGGVKAIDDFVHKNTNKCKENILGDVTIMLTISPEGLPEFDQILSGDVTHCQYEELQDLARKMPKWTPAIRYGIYVESTYVIRISYK